MRSADLHALSLALLQTISCSTVLPKPGHKVAFEYIPNFLFGQLDSFTMRQCAFSIQNLHLFRSFAIFDGDTISFSVGLSFLG